MKNLFALFSLIFFLIACDKDAEYDKDKAISAFAKIDPIQIDKSLEKTEIKFPKQQNNLLWSGSASWQNQQIENFEKNFTVKERGFFTKTREISFKKSSPTWFFYSGDIDDHFVYAPIIKENKLFVLDAAGVLSAYDLSSEKRIWKSRIFEKSFLKNYRTPKISYADGKIFAIAGVNRIVAASEEDGKVLWSKEIAAIPVSTPLSDGKLVYVSTNDNKLYAFDSSNGELSWVQSGISRPTAILGAADPIIYKDLVIVSYSSGEIYGVNKKSGEPLWSQDLNINKATSSDFYLNDVDATPVAKDGMIYAIGNGGLMMAISAKDGNYSWKKQIAGIVDFWLAGDFIFVINNDNKLLSISKKTGGIKWISQLPYLKKEKKPQTKFIYSGIVMAGDKLLLSSLDGELMVISPFDGKVEKTLELDKKISHSPVVVNGKIYLHTIGKYIIDLIEIE